MSQELHPKDGHADMTPISFNSRRTLLGILAIAAAAILLLIGIRYAFL
jgi:hypothetical protein